MSQPPLIQEIFANNTGNASPEDQVIAILEARQTSYKLLAVLYQHEVTPQTLETLKKIAFPRSPTNTKLTQAGIRLETYIENLTNEGLDELAADYARTFLGAGIAEGEAAFPFESVYTSPEHLVMQDAYEEMTNFLRKAGYRPMREDLYADHIGIELEVMSALIKGLIRGFQENNMEEFRSNMILQHFVLNRHIRKWCNKFFADQARVANTDFYKALAELTEAFLEEDSKWLADFVQDKAPNA